MNFMIFIDHNHTTVYKEGGKKKEINKDKLTFPAKLFDAIHICATIVGEPTIIVAIANGVGSASPPRVAYTHEAIRILSRATLQFPAKTPLVTHPVANIVEYLQQSHREQQSK